MKNRSEDMSPYETLSFANEEVCPLIFNNLDEIFLLISKELKIIGLNETTRQKIFTYFNKAITPGASILELAPPHRHKDLIKIYDAVFNGEESTTETVIEENGSCIYLENHFKPARNNKGEIIAALVVTRDITDNKKAEAALKEIEERWRFALEGGNQGVWDWNIQTGEVFYSDSYKRLYGFAVDELRGRIEEWETMIHPEDRKKMNNAIEEHMSSTDPFYESTYRIKTKDGNYKWILARGMLVSKDEKGNPLRMIGTHTDISKQIAAEQTYKVLFYSNPLPMWTYEMETLRFLSVNDAAIQHYGYSKEEFLSMTIKDIRPKEDVRKLMAIIQTRKKFGHLKTVHRHVKKNGELIYVEVSTHRLENSDTNAVLVVVHDITSKIKAEEELQKSNERFLLASRATSDAIYDWDLITNELHWGEGLQKLFGYQPTDVSISLWEDLIHPGDRDRVHRGLYKALFHSETELWKGEYRFAKADGSYSYVLDRGFIIRDQNHKPTRVIGSMQDITDRKLLEQELLQNELEKQKAINQASVDSQEQERTEIGKELHDNVNQILTTTKLYLDLALSNAELKDELIQKSNKNIISVINEIRQLSRSLMDPTIGDLGLIDSINDLVENINLTGKLIVSLEAEKELDRLLDQNHKLAVFRIIQEALNNIITHAKATIVGICFRLKNDTVEVSIKDNGIGFDPSSVKLGAGLKNIQNRVYLINGTYIIKAEPKNGCTIVINFPINKQLNSE